MISQTPLRVSLLGGGSDYFNYFSKHGGLVVGGAIDKYQYIHLRRLPPFFEYKTRLSYSKIETVKHNSEIEHNIIREAIKFCYLEEESVEMSAFSDMPGSCGIGSSSAFAAGLLNCLFVYRNPNYRLTPYALMKNTVDFEQNHMKEHENVGVQDTVFACYGGFNIIELHTDESFVIRKLYLDEEELANNLLLLYDRQPRRAADVVKTFINKLPNNKQMAGMRELTEKGIEYLSLGKYELLGETISASWIIKKSLSKQVSTDTIDRNYQTALDAGAFGGKIIGAGGGGCLLMVVAPDLRQQVIDATGLLEIPFKFVKEGSKIIYEN